MLALRDIHKSEILSFVAEVFYTELQGLNGIIPEEDYYVFNKGVSRRSHSQDVIDITKLSLVENDVVKEVVFVHLSRNSLYHKLPEIFFFPLTIGDPSFSINEKIDVVKQNARIEKDNIQFFSPFDSELFNFKVKLTSRFLHLFNDKNSKKNLYKLSRQLIKKNLELDKNQVFLLLIQLCDIENIKENLARIEEVIYTVLGLKTALSFKPKYLFNSAFGTLGNGTLGYGFGLQGVVKSELDDMLVKISFEGTLSYKKITSYVHLIREIVDFFVIAGREVLVEYSFSTNDDYILGEKFLGYDTLLKH